MLLSFVVNAKKDKGRRRRTESKESSSRLDRAILLSRCYFAIARLERGNIVEPAADFFDIERKTHRETQWQSRVGSSVTENRRNRVSQRKEIPSRSGSFPRFVLSHLSSSHCETIAIDGVKCARALSREYASTHLARSLAGTHGCPPRLTEACISEVRHARTIISL